MKNKDVLQQVCTVADIQETESGKKLFLLPEKKQCSTCNGKCAKMMKPDQYIEYIYNADDIAKGDKVLMHMSKTDLNEMVMLVLGLPLFLLLILIIILSALNISELYIIISSLITVILSFIIINKTLTLPKQVEIRKIDK